MHLCSLRVIVTGVMAHDFKRGYSALLGLPMCEQSTAAVREMSFTDRHHLDIFKALHYALVQIN